MATPLLRKLTVGEILDVSFGIYRSRFTSLFLVAAAVQVVPVSLSLIVPTMALKEQHPFISLAWVTAVILATPIGVAGCTLVVSSAYLGHSITAWEALRKAWPFIWRLMLISMSSAFLVACGFIALFLPAFYMYTGLVMAPVVAVLEAPIGVSKAMGRSWELAKGQRWKIGLAMMVPYLLVSVPGSALAVVIVLVGESAQIYVDLATAVLTIFFMPFVYVVTAMLYYDQRVRKEAFDLELLANTIQAE